MTSRQDANREAVAAELAVLRARVRGEDVQQERLAAAREALGGPSTLDEIADGFGLTGFERAVLLLAAGPELVGEVAEELDGHLTFARAMAVLPDPHWSAITPPGPLRHWSLLHLRDPASPVRSPLVVDERVLHHIAGAGHMDAGLAAASRPIAPVDWLPETLSQAAGTVAAAWRADRAVALHGPQRGNVQAVFAGAAGRLGLVGYSVAAADIPADPVAREGFLRRMERETVLGGCAWLVEASSAPVEAVAGMHGPVAVLDGVTVADAVSVGVPRLEVSERREVLASALRRAGCEIARAETDTAAGVFDLALPDVEEVAREVADGTGLWDACRARSRGGLASLATALTPRAGWDDLVLPESQLAQLRALVAAVRHRSTVLDDWGFAARSGRGLGSTALFAGPSGTGKTLAAEVLAAELALSLMVIDLSQVVSKWIGETEKNLARVFDAAEGSGSVLLFDEADSLFGRRTEIRDAHDRYANIEVNYLLQRMEQYRGLAILTTNTRGSLDPAFTRRLSTIVTFPYPGPELRRRIWEGVFPVDTPVEIDAARLSAIDVPGGGIAAIALTAAYLAAEEGSDVGDRHVLAAARWELAKTGRSAGGAR